MKLPSKVGDSKRFKEDAMESKQGDDEANNLSKKNKKKDKNRSRSKERRKSRSRDRADNDKGNKTKRAK
jgi:hypothetical protein